MSNQPPTKTSATQATPIGRAQRVALDVAAPAAPAPKVAIVKMYTDEINVATVCTILGVKDLRVKDMCRRGQIPSAQKNVQGFWKFSRTQVDAFAAARPAGKAHGSKDGRAKYEIRLNLDEKVLLEKALQGTELELKRPVTKSKKVTPAPEAAPAE